MKFEHAVFEICERVDKQTDIQTPIATLRVSTAGEIIVIIVYY